MIIAHLSIFGLSDFLRDDFNHGLDYHVIVHIVTVHVKLILKLFSKAEESCCFYVAGASFQSDLIEENLLNACNSFFIAYFEFNILMLIADFNVNVFLFG